MIRSLVIKEFWDLRGVIALGVVIHGLLLTNLLGVATYDWIPMREPAMLPFPKSFPAYLAAYTILFAGLMGLFHGLNDGWGQRWLFVLPMPMRTSHWMLGRVAFGLGLWALFGVGTYLLGIAIVNLPGVFPAPFEWWMARNGWNFLAMAPLVYLSGFLSAIRQGAWFGTKLLPLLGTLILVELLVEDNDFHHAYTAAYNQYYLWLYVPGFLFAYVVMIFGILQASKQRDYP